MEEYTRRDLLAKLGLGAAAAMVPASAMAQSPKPRASGLTAHPAPLRKFEPAEVLKGIKPDRAIPFKLPDAEGAPFQVEVRGTGKGYFVKAVYKEPNPRELGIAPDKSMLTLGVKPGANRSVELIGLDSVIARSTQQLANRLGSVAASNHGRCNVMSSMAVAQVDPDPGPDPFSPATKPSALIRF